MRCGISTACFYPEETQAALERVGEMGCEVTEVFLNTFRETEEGYLLRLRKTADAMGVKVSSVHPFTGPLEGLLFASEYATRAADGIDFYRQYFRACQVLGADKLVFHGDRAFEGAQPMEKHAAIIRNLAQAGLEYGVTLCYENVYYCRLGCPAKVRAIRPLLGKYAAFTLDLKQLRRANATLQDMLDAMGRDVRQVHISDCDSKHDCIPPGEGTFDFGGLFEGLEKLGYQGDLIIELYRDGFKSEAQLERSLQYMQGLLKQRKAQSAVSKGNS